MSKKRQNNVIDIEVRRRSPVTPGGFFISSIDHAAPRYSRLSKQ
jgi:hypothetical protein